MNTNFKKHPLPYSNGTAGTTMWSVTHETQSRVHRFLHAQRQSIVSSPGTPGLHVARLVLLDGILPSYLPDIQDQKSAPYLGPEGIAIEWLCGTPQRLERRLLSPLTALAWPEISCVESTVLGEDSSESEAGDQHPALLSLLTDWLKNQSLYRDLQDPVTELEKDMLCSLNDVLPASLFAHAANLSPLSAIPSSAWARLHMKLAVRLPNDLSDAAPEDESRTSEILNAMYDATGTTISPVALNQILDVFSHTPPSIIDGWIKRHWAKELSNLRGRLAATSPKATILCAWVASMCEEGTTQSSNPAAKTVKGYAHIGLRPLAHALTSMSDDPDTWQASELLTVYRSIYDTAAQSRRSQMGAALACFHQFLTKWFDVDPLLSPISDGQPSGSPVDANIVWDHEIDLSIKLAGNPNLGREGKIVQVLLAIARWQGVRIQDLQRLRLCNVYFGLDERGKFCEIEIVRDASRGRLKTDSSQRRILIRNDESIAIIRAWMEHRISEGAPNTAFLFGEVADDNRLYWVFRSNVTGHSGPS